MKQERHSQAVSSSCGLVLLDSLHFNKWKRVCSCKYRTVQQVSLTLSFGVTKVSYYSWVVLSLVKKNKHGSNFNKGAIFGIWEVTVMLTVRLQCILSLYWEKGNQSSDL